MLLEHEKDFYGQAAGDLPDEAKLQAAIELLATELRALKQAPVVDPYIRDITGGSTNTSNYGDQAFKGQPRLVYRVQ